MGKFSGFLLATDFDDTYFTKEGIVPPENRAAVDHWIAEGGWFTVATGRARQTFAPYLSVAPVNAPVVLSNGAQLYDFAKGKMLVEKTMPSSIAPDLEEIFAEVPGLGLEAYHKEDVYVYHPNDWTRHHIRRAGVSAVECAISAVPQPWGKAILYQERPVLEQVQAIFHTRWPDRYEAIFSNPHMLELTARESTKGSMVLHLASLLHVPREHIYCIGDNENDLPMLAISAVPFAPANCAPMVKAWGVHLLPPCPEAPLACLVRFVEEHLPF